jgi:hypothetical protein
MKNKEGKGRNILPQRQDEILISFLENSNSRRPLTNITTIAREERWMFI